MAPTTSCPVRHFQISTSRVRVARGATSAQDLVALGLAVKQGSKVIPTDVGILAACPDPTQFLPSAWVQCGRLRGSSGTDIFDQIEIHKPIPQAVDDVTDHSAAGYRANEMPTCVAMTVGMM